MRARRGMTLVEVLIAAGLLSLLFFLTFRAWRVVTLSWNTVEKLDALQTLRVAEVKLRRELETGTAVLYPRPDMTEPVSRVVYTGATNGLKVLYRAEDGTLRLQAYGGEPEVLCHSVAAFTARQPLAGQLCCELTVDTGAGGTMSLPVAVFAGNGFCGNGATQ